MTMQIEKRGIIVKEDWRPSEGILQIKIIPFIDNVEICRLAKDSMGEKLKLINLEESKLACNGAHITGRLTDDLDFICRCHCTKYKKEILNRFTGGILLMWN
jgi:hypothetical protein